MKTAFCSVLSFTLVFTAAPTSQAQLLWTVGQDDNTDLRTGDGGGANATFWQENGSINALPGNPANPEADQQSDNDYYFAGSYSTAIDSVVALYGTYTPVGNILV